MQYNLRRMSAFEKTKWYWAEACPTNAHARLRFPKSRDTPLVTGGDDVAVLHVDLN